MTIRKATTRETQFILRYASQVMNEATMGYVNTDSYKAQQMMSAIIADGGYYLVYVEDGVIRGWIGIGAAYNFYSEKMEGMIPELYVLPAFRNKGIAEKLCREACRRLENAGYQKVQLNVFARNHAKHLYDKLGFNDVSILMEKGLS